MEKHVKVTRVFDASVDQVWEVWTDPELVKQWWGPDKFVCPVAKIDFREGGTSLVCMRAPTEFGGADSFSIWNYVKIVHHQSIEFIQNLADAEGRRQKPVTLGMPPDFPEDVRTVVTFRVLGKNKTEMTVIEYADFGSISKFAQMGLDQSADKMFAIFKN